MAYVTFWVLTRQEDSKHQFIQNEYEAGFYNYSLNALNTTDENRQIAILTDATLLSWLGAAALGVLFQYFLIEPLVILMRFSVFPFILKRWGRPHVVRPSSEQQHPDKPSTTTADVETGAVVVAGAEAVGAGEIVKGGFWERSSEAAFNLLAEITNNIIYV